MTASPQVVASVVSSVAGWLEAELSVAARRVDACAARRDGRAVANEETDLGFERAGAPIGRLARALGLRPLEVEVLVAALLPVLEPTLGDACTRLSARGRVDLDLIAELHGLDRARRLDLLDAIDPERPLVALRLILVEPGDGRSPWARQIQVPLDVVPVLAGRAELSSILARSAQLVHARPTLDDLLLDDVARARLTDTCSALAIAAEGAQPPWVIAWGPRGAGKATVAARIAAYAGRPLLQFDPSTVADGSGDEQLRRAQREALLHDAVLYLGPLGDELLANNARDLVRRLRDFPGMVVLGVDAAAPPRIATTHPVHELALPAFGERERLALWTRQLGHAGKGLALDALARGFHLTPGEIIDIAGEAAVIATTRGVTINDLRAGIDRRLRNELGELARPMNVDTSWNDLILPEDQLARVREVVERHRLGDRVLREWGLGARLGYGKGVIALFSGPPGTGKTMLATVIAKDLGLDLYKVDLSQVVSKWVGETEKQLGRLFDLAARAHAVLLFDEADALLGARTKVESSNDRYGNLAVNYLLTRLEEYTGVAILTTNLESSLDPAIQRRLTMHLRLALPTAEERSRLWRSFLPATIPGARAIDTDALAEEYEFAGGHIKNAAVRAAFFAASKGAHLDMQLARRAARHELEDMGRL